MPALMPMGIAYRGAADLGQMYYATNQFMQEDRSIDMGLTGVQIRLSVAETLAIASAEAFFSLVCPHEEATQPRIRELTQ